MKRGRALALAAAIGVAVAAALAAMDALLPPDLARGQARSVVVTDAQHEMLRAFTTSDGKWRLPVRAAEVDERYLRLLRAYEDRRFEEHRGVDPLALLRALGQYLTAGHVVSGGSTLTMQTARLLEPRPRGLSTKLIQITRALQLERRLDKPEILSLYLMLAPFGGNLEGVRAASLAYFGKEPAHLTLGEAALLVALPQSPERLRPDRHPEAALKGRDKVLTRLAAAGAITTAEAAEARTEPLPQQRLAVPFRAPHLAQHLAAKAASGSVIATTLDGSLQRAAEALAAAELRRGDDGANLAIVVIDNRSHALRAYIGGGDFWARGGQVDLARARRSPGSALKPFIYGMGFDDGVVHPATLIDDAPMRFGDYTPRDFDRDYQGTVSVRVALQQSLNVPAVALLDRVGPVRLVSNLRQAGAGLSFRRLVGTPSLPVALGGVGISLADLTMLYAGIAEGGRVRAPALIEGAMPGEPQRIMSETAAWYVADILADSPLPEGWVSARALAGARRIAFKTGTSYGFRDAWAVGFSAGYTVGVWTGRDDGSPRPGHFGRRSAAPILLKVFDLLPAEAPQYPRPPKNALLAGSSTQLPPPLRHFARERLTPTLRGTTPPEILFPPDGAQIAWSPEQDGGIALKATGGSGPLFWIVNGHPLPPAPLAADEIWRPDGEGFARIAVIDAEGRSTAVRVRVKAGPQ